MSPFPSKPGVPVWVLARDGKWCRAKYKRTARYQDSVATACGHYIVAPHGIEQRHRVAKAQDICPDCRKVKR